MNNDIDIEVAEDAYVTRRAPSARADEPSHAMSSAEAVSLLNRIAGAESLKAKPKLRRTWFNGTKNPQTVLFQTGNAEYPRLRVTWAVGERHALDAMWDSAIHQLVEMDGRVVVAGGGAPMLSRLVPPQLAPVHPALLGGTEQ